MSRDIIARCRQLRAAYEQKTLGDMRMPEDAAPSFTAAQHDAKLTYFTLPMALNYQRDSYALWRAAVKTFEDAETADVFCLSKAAGMTAADLRHKLLKHKLALQPNKHVDTWQRLAKVFADNWSSVRGFVDHHDADFEKMRMAAQKTFKKDFPYLSGPKLFNYWSYILIEYGGLALKNRDCIDIAPDTHVIQASVRLGILSAEEAVKADREFISERWRQILQGSGLAPIDMHSPLWFWSRNSFQYALQAA